MDKIKALLKSRKFWAAVVGLGLVVIKAFVPDFPLTGDQLNQVVWVLVAFILGTGLEDARALDAFKQRYALPDVKGPQTK